MLECKEGFIIPELIEGLKKGEKFSVKCHTGITVDARDDAGELIVNPSGTTRGSTSDASCNPNRRLWKEGGSNCAIYYDGQDTKWFDGNTAQEACNEKDDCYWEDRTEAPRAGCFLAVDGGEEWYGPDCTCHVSCGKCGYTADATDKANDPTGPIDCITCKNPDIELEKSKYPIRGNVVYQTGYCGTVALNSPDVVTLRINEKKYLYLTCVNDDHDGTHVCQTEKITGDRTEDFLDARSQFRIEEKDGRYNFVSVETDQVALSVDSISDINYGTIQRLGPVTGLVCDDDNDDCVDNLIVCFETGFCPGDKGIEESESESESKDEGEDEERKKKKYRLRGRSSETAKAHRG
eukprot:TRINITY_DN5936_c0_g2_i1.p1 TRINITY_DN5936_c0_g2~~TRINITY_DN5936_c0_g2_i1.p1  ORF type:complete len:350 (+),score=84.80 TRINITY_DN5936_c0_g2_i1:482-1531(+)